MTHEFVVVDLGASTTRYTSSRAGGEIKTIPNNAMFIEEGNTNFIETFTENSRVVSMEPVDDEVAGSDINDNLELIIDKSEQSTIFPMHGILGKLAQSCYSDNIKPSLDDNKKCVQRINYLSIITAVALSKVQHDFDDSPLTVWVALPPLECRNGYDVFSRELVGKYTVYLPKTDGGKQVTFEIGEIKCAAESSLAVVSFLLSYKGNTVVYNADNNKFTSNSILSVDIGASTTDLMLYENGRPLKVSGMTYHVGGNDAIEFIRNYYRENGKEISTERASMILSEGREKMGINYVDASAVSLSAKRAVVDKLFNFMQTYFKKIGRSITDVDIILLSGGGSLPSSYIDETGEYKEVVKPISGLFLDKLTSGDIYASVIDIPDCRMANIKGLFIKGLQYSNAKAQAMKATEQVDM